jgi:hypothetical protein
MKACKGHVQWQVDAPAHAPQTVVLDKQALAALRARCAALATAASRCHLFMERRRNITEAEVSAINDVNTSVTATPHSVGEPSMHWHTQIYAILVHSAYLATSSARVMLHTAQATWGASHCFVGHHNITS